MERSRIVEDLHHLRLMALLHELVRERELKGAAEALGLDPRTLSASMDRGALSGLAQVALERWLLAEGDREAARCREGVQALAGRVDGVEERVGELAAQVDQAVAEVQRVAGASAGPHGEDVARDLRRLERRMDRLESGGRGGANPPASGSAGRHAGANAPERRRYPDLVTVDPAGDDEEVFGEAWPLVHEWRGLWRDHPDRGRGLRWLTTEGRILELEVAMLEEHGLTLPPETEPLRGLARNAQLGAGGGRLWPTPAGGRPGAGRCAGCGGGSPWGCGGGRPRRRRGRRRCFIVAPLPLHRRFLGVSDRVGAAQVGRNPLAGDVARTGY